MVSLRSTKCASVATILFVEDLAIFAAFFMNVI